VFHVTGVQQCALPLWKIALSSPSPFWRLSPRALPSSGSEPPPMVISPPLLLTLEPAHSQTAPREPSLPVRLPLARAQKVRSVFSPTEPVRLPLSLTMMLVPDFRVRLS